MKFIRILFLITAIALIAYSIVMRRDVHKLDGSKPDSYSCSDFIKSATIDRVIRKDGKLTDRASAAGASADIDDCPT